MKKYMMWLPAMILVLTACSDSFLDEEPKNFLGLENVLVDTKGFNTINNGMYGYVRQEFQTWGGTNTLVGHGACPYEVLQTGLDICTSTIVDNSLALFTNYSFNSSNAYINNRWRWAYGIISNANTMINKAEDASVNWTNADDKVYFQAHARFFRAYAYRQLVYLFGDVPWVTVVESQYRNDFVRTPRMEVVEHIIDDLEFASKYLPADLAKVKDGQLTKWTALHLLSEICNFSGNYKRAETAALEVIDAPYFSLMEARFGAFASKPGDPFSDMFKEDNHNRAGGNRESIFVVQSGYSVTGGSDASTDWTRRAWVPAYYSIGGFIISDEYGGRGVGQIRPLQWWLDSYESQDMRNSEYNIRREWYYNDPASALFGTKHVITEDNTLRGRCFPTTTKFDYMPASDPTSNGNMKDKTRFRLGETYLLLAEAYINQNNIPDATNAINMVRNRAKATLADEAEVNMDYLLDERARELLGEEMRRFTLIRTGKLLERTRKYNEVSGLAIKDHQVLWPVPQVVIDANWGLKWDNNPGWN